jgi:hypothetical protein
LKENSGNCLVRVGTFATYKNVIPKGKTSKHFCNIVINVIQSMKICFPGMEKLTGIGLEYVAHLTLEFWWPRCIVNPAV